MAIKLKTLKKLEPELEPVFSYLCTNIADLNGEIARLANAHNTAIETINKIIKLIDNTSITKTTNSLKHCNGLKNQTNCKFAVKVIDHKLQKKHRPLWVLPQNAYSVSDFTSTSKTTILYNHIIQTC